MALPFNRNPDFEERRSVALPEKFLCRVCDKWKPKIHYSKKELDGYTWKNRSSHRVTAITAKLRCRLCAGTGISEFLCEGPCGELLPIDRFSKSSRATGGNKWCKLCTLWKQSHEDGLIAPAPPESELAPDEDEGFFPDGALGSFYDPEAGDADDDDDYEYEPHGGSADLGLNDHLYLEGLTDSTVVQTPNTLIEGLANMALSSGRESVHEPTTLGNRDNIPLKSSDASDYGSSRLRSSFVGSAGRDRSGNVSEASSWISNPFAASGITKSPSEAEWTLVDAYLSRGGPAPTPVVFNAWDNRGQQHVRQRCPSISDQTSDSKSVFSTTSISSTSGSKPALASRAATSQALASNDQSSNAKWAKPAGIRSQPIQYQPMRPSTTSRKVVDSDSEEDYI